MTDERLPFVKNSDDAIRAYESANELTPSFSDEEINNGFKQIKIISKAAEKAQQVKDERLTRKNKTKKVSAITTAQER